MIFHILTVVLFVLKVLDVVQISWWLVLTPSITKMVIGIVMLVGVLIITARAKS